MTPSKTAEEVCFGLLGAGQMREGILSESVTWQNGDNVHVGRTSVISAIKPDDAISVKVDDVVTHGKAAAVSGRLKTEGEAFLFCP